MQLTVDKSDGTREVYLHTKVLGTIAMAMSDCDVYDGMQANKLSEAVTTYLRRQYDSSLVASDEIHAMIVAVLTDTTYETVALSLHDHRMLRHIRRGRVEVYSSSEINEQQLLYSNSDTEFDDESSAQPWNKSIIVKDLVGESELDVQMARAIASAVEEKVLRLECCSVSSSLVKELVCHEIYHMRKAEKALAEQVKIEAEDHLVATVC